MTHKHVTATEWDLTFVYFDDAYNHTHQQVLEHARSSSKEDVVFMLVSSIERGVRYENGLPVPKEKASYHAHGALITRKPSTYVDALAYFGVTVKDDVTGVPLNRRWAAPRKKHLTYLGWYMHHTKPQTKIGDEEADFCHGVVPNDDKTYDNAVKICAIAKKYKKEQAYQVWKQVREANRPRRARPSESYTAEHKEDLKRRRKETQARYNNRPEVKHKKQIADRQRNFKKLYAQYESLFQLDNKNVLDNLETNLRIRLRNNIRIAKTNVTFHDAFLQWCKASNLTVHEL